MKFDHFVIYVAPHLTFFLVCNLAVIESLVRLHALPL